MSMKDITDKMNGDIDKDIRGRTIELFKAIILTTPVGNPDLWKINHQSAAYNRAVSDENYRLRQDPSNLTKAGRLKKGRKVNDSMDIKKPDGYVGGRARGNWHCSIGVPIPNEIDRIDATGAGPIADVLATVKAGEINYLSNNVPYIRRLEYKGHSSQAPEGMVRIAIERFGLGEST